MGSFVSLDLLVFFFMFELTLVPSYFIIAGWGHERRAYAALKFFLYTFLGSAFLLVGILAAGLHPRVAVPLPDLLARAADADPPLVDAPRSCSSWPSRPPSRSRRRCSRCTPGRPTPTPRRPRRARSAARACWPSWAPTASSASTSASSLRPRATLAPLLLTLAVIGIVYGAIVACAQRDLKRVVTYSSLAQIGFIALGTFALSTQALAGSVLLMLNHGIIVAALFILIGFIYKRRGTWQANELRGLQKAAPVMAAVFTVAMMASIGVPGLNGFVERVPGAVGHLHHPSLVGRRRRARRDRGRHLPAVGLPAGLPWRARGRQTRRPGTWACWRWR